MSIRSFALATATIATIAGSSAAHADTGGNVDLSSFRPAMDSRGYLTINASQVLGDKEVSFGLGSLDWGHHLLELSGNGDHTYTINNIITATLVGAFGIHAGPVELEFGISAPFKLMAGDIAPDKTNQPNSNDNKDYKVDGQGIGNIGLHFKTRFLKTSKGPHIGLGVIASVYLGQTTSPKGAFLGENTAVPQVMGILDKEFGRDGRLKLALNGGIRIRKSTTFTNDDPGKDPMTPTTGARMTAGTEIPYGFGISYAISRQKFDVVGEIFGALPLGDHENYQPLEAIAGVKLYLARNSFLSLGGGRGLIPNKGANPDLRAFIGIVFEPSLGDRDGDGLKDDVDRCPNEPEDFDAFEDEDGCPEPDNDRDQILDEDDKCPNIPENRDGFQDEDGCPDDHVNDRDGDRINDNIDKCPDDPEDYDGFEDEDGCPDPDNDMDKILDVDDLCPNDPEDYDKFEDEDGCPDLDNDKDRILDKDDKCINEPETYNNVDDQDGCPDRGITELTGSGIVTLEPIQFEFNKAIIKKASYPILDAVIATMNGNPDIELIEVQGHTDERGDDAYNLDLSERRAAAVVEYLTTHGTTAEPVKPVPANRLTSQGYGETQPVDRRHNEAAWATNRRVAFIILKRATD